MTDVNAEAEKTLQKLKCSVVYQYPEVWTDLPAVSFYNLAEKGAFYADNEEGVQSGYVQLDVWANEPAECGRLSLEVNEVMTQDGWTREMSRDIPKGNEKIYHRTMRFHKYFTC